MYCDAKSFYSDSNHSHTGSSYQNSPAPCFPVDSYSSQICHGASLFTRPLTPSSPQPLWPTNTNAPFADYDHNTVLTHNESSYGHSSPHGRQGQPHPSVLPPSMAGEVQQIWEPRPIYAFNHSARDQPMAYRLSFGDSGLHF